MQREQRCKQNHNERNYCKRYLSNACQRELRKCYGDLQNRQTELRNRRVWRERMRASDC